MADGVRRVVTGHDGEGKAVVLSDTDVALPRFGNLDAWGAVVWTTGTVPADNVADMAGSAREAGSTLRGGSVLRVTEFGPGFRSPMHRTLSIDYLAVLAGELELHADGSEVVRLKEGDVLVQRGTNHAWSNPSPDTPCRVLVCMIEALPVAVGGRLLEQTL